MVRTKDLEGPGHNRTTELTATGGCLHKNIPSASQHGVTHKLPPLATADGYEERKLNFKGCGPFEVNHTSVNGLIPMYTDSTSWMQWVTLKKKRKKVS